MTPLDGLAFAADPLDRASYRREDKAEVADLRARDDARAIVIARDMPVLSKSATGLQALLPMAEIDALLERTGMSRAMTIARASSRARKSATSALSSRR